MGADKGLLEVEVVEIRGYCPVYRVGDKMVIDNPRIVLDKNDPLCTSALSSLQHYVQDLEKGADPDELGLTKPEDRTHAYIQCMEQCKLYTYGGTVVFRCRRIRARSK